MGTTFLMCFYLQGTASSVVETGRDQFARAIAKMVLPVLLKRALPGLKGQLQAKRGWTRVMSSLAKK